MENTNTGYETALKKVIDVRLQRKKVYGNGWKTSDDWELAAMIKNKTGRLTHLIFNSDVQSNEKIEDTLIDLINYGLFLLQNRVERGENGTKK